MNIQKNIIENPITEFPITRNVVKQGLAFHPLLNVGDRVSCYYCSSPIKVNAKTAFRVEGDDSEMQYIECPKCHMRVSVLYYFDRKVLNGQHTKEPGKRRRRRCDDLAVDSVQRNAESIRE